MAKKAVKKEEKRPVKKTPEKEKIVFTVGKRKKSVARASFRKGCMAVCIGLSCMGNLQESGPRRHGGEGRSRAPQSVRPAIGCWHVALPRMDG